MNYNASFGGTPAPPHPLRPWLGLAAVCVVIASAISVRATALKEGNSELRTQVAGVEDRTAHLAPGAEMAEGVSPHLGAELEIPDKLRSIRNRPRWGEALRATATAAGGEVTVQAVHESETEAYPGHCELQITAVAQTRAKTDIFRGKMERALQSTFPGKSASVRIESIEEQTPGRVVFTVVAAIRDESAPSEAAGGKP